MLTFFTDSLAANVVMSAEETVLGQMASTSFFMSFMKEIEERKTISRAAKIRYSEFGERQSSEPKWRNSRMANSEW